MLVIVRNGIVNLSSNPWQGGLYFRVIFFFTNVFEKNMYLSSPQLLVNLSSPALVMQRI